MDERVAYVCFRTAEDAREAKVAKPRIILFDKVALVDPVYESTKTEAYRVRPRSISPAEYERHYYPRSPGPERRRPPPAMEHHPYERYGPPTGMHHPSEFRPEFAPMHHGHPPRGPPMHHRPELSCKYLTWNY